MFVLCLWEQLMLPWLVLKNCGLADGFQLMFVNTRWIINFLCLHKHVTPFIMRTLSLYSCCIWLNLELRPHTNMDKWIILCVLGFICHTRHYKWQQSQVHYILYYYCSAQKFSSVSSELRSTSPCSRIPRVPNRQLPPRWVGVIWLLAAYDLCLYQYLTYHMYNSSLSSVYLY